jgi:uncharacterized membrane protein
MKERLAAIDADVPRAENARLVAANTDRRSVVLFGATLLMGLLAGLFYAFACAVIVGLSDAHDRTLIDGMQHINDSIENPVFFLSFLGAPALAIWSLIIERRAGDSQIVRYVVAAIVLYGVAFLVTSAFNIPLNNDLKDAGDVGQIGDLAKVRDDFLGPWIAWNIVRTVASIAAFGCLAWALVLRGRAR